MMLELTWVVISLLGFFRSLTLWREAVVDRRVWRAFEKPNGHLILANGAVEHRWMGSIIYFLALCPGVMALAYKLGATSLEGRLFIVPFFLIAMLVVLAIRQERDLYWRKKSLGQPYIMPLRPLARQLTHVIRLRLLRR